ncbi:MAG: LacI family transcriptional regulator [Tissierellia bacterium]|jgi:LacI family transcriptional regulator|nr:LacI family transcriptional regulator [Tissierellia bacterium]
MKITIKEIAKEAGVSTATVSMIVNNKDKRISEATRKRVLDVIKKYNYVPNAVAGSLVTQKTHIIGLILPDITNPFFPGIARGAEDKAHESGYSIIFSNSDGKHELEEKHIETLTKKMADGIIIVLSSENEHMSELLKKCKVPVVLIDRDLSSVNIRGKVLVDNFKGSYDAVTYLSKNGYKKIAYLSGPLNTKTASERLKGYKQALIDNKLIYDPKTVKCGEYKIEWGQMGVDSLLAEKADFDSIFCGNDLIAVGAMKQLKNHKIRVPEDIGIMGYDDIYMSSYVEPSLTTVKQPIYQMGYKAMELMLNILKSSNKETSQEIKTIILDTEIVERNSIKRKV